MPLEAILPATNFNGMFCLFLGTASILQVLPRTVLMTRIRIQYFKVGGKAYEVIGGTSIKSWSD